MAGGHARARRPAERRGKLSGLGTFIHRNDPAHIAWIVGETVALFGAERCLFGSNFPIEKLWTDYRSLIAAYRAAIAPVQGGRAAWGGGGGGGRLNRPPGRITARPRPGRRARGGGGKGAAPLVPHLG